MVYAHICSHFDGLMGYFEIKNIENFTDLGD